jgi:gluconate 2-dehydrogenase gamma chain
MKRRTGLSRRKFIQFAVSAAAAAPAISCSKATNPWRFFSAEEAKTLEALCGQIVPADRDPGALQAGAVNYIDRQLVGALKRHQKAYREGLAGVNQSSRALHGRKLHELPHQEQLALLQKLEKGEAPGEAWKRRSSKAFFALVVDHTMQGFYGDPRHGGNRDAVSWRMLDLPYPPVRGRLQYDLTKSAAKG